METAEFIQVAVAAWRLSYMLVKENGPGDILVRLRTDAHIPDCIFCVSVWTAAGMYIAWRTALRPLVVVLALSGAALGYQSWTGLDRDY